MRKDDELQVQDGVAADAPDDGGHAFPGQAVEPRLRPVHPVAGTIAMGSLTLPALRFLLHPDVPPHKATEVIA